MRFEVYCDETLPDLFDGPNDRRARYLMIGSLWLASRNSSGCQRKDHCIAPPSRRVGRDEVDQNFALQNRLSMRS